MKNNNKFWLVTELFYPDETATGFYLTGIAKHIAYDREINVICGPASYEKNSNLVANQEALPDTIKLHRISILALDKNKLFTRVLRLLNLTFAFSYKLLKSVKKGDVVWLVTNPAFLVPIAAVLAKIKGFRLTILVHDVFPENLVPVNLSNPKKISYQLMKYVFNKAYSSANHLVVCGRDMAFLFEQKIGFDERDKIEVIENWADIDIVYPTNNNKPDSYQCLGIEGKIIFQFAGNLGRLQGLEELLTIIDRCSNPMIHFIIIGEGALKSTLKSMAEEKKMTNVSFLNSFNRNQQNIFLNACDVGIVSLYDSMLGLGVPSKSYNIMAAGKPILYLGNKNSEIGMMINEYGIGWQFELAQTNEIIDFLNLFDKNSIGEKGTNARLVAERQYAKHHILAKYEQLTKLS